MIVQVHNSKALFELFKGPSNGGLRGFSGFRVWGPKEESLSV